MVETVLTFILINSKYLRRKTTFSADHSLPVKTIGCLHDVSGGTQAVAQLKNLTIITMVAQASNINFKEILSHETSMDECKCYDGNAGEVLEFSVNGGSLVHIVLSHADFSTMCKVKTDLTDKRDF